MNLRTYIITVALLATIMDANAGTRKPYAGTGLNPAHPAIDLIGQYTVVEDGIACLQQNDAIISPRSRPDRKEIEANLVDAQWCLPLHKNDIVHVEADAGSPFAVCILVSGVNGRCLWTDPLNLKRID
jgi:hypothetical protein